MKSAAVKDRSLKLEIKGIKKRAISFVGRAAVRDLSPHIYLEQYLQEHPNAVPADFDEKIDEVNTQKEREFFLSVYNIFIDKASRIVIQQDSE